MKTDFDMGTLDRTGTLFSNAPAPGSGGALEDVLKLVGTVYLRRVSVSSRTILAGARDAEDTEDVFVMRYVYNLRSGWHLNFEGTDYRITRRDEIGRRVGWRVYCRAIT